ncbi:TIGR03936 family radical SAM-associated protein [Diplocloster agilis]|uniref:TIGR03936 family radical SAM-associated protein n=1 Tax=Diplocloster agilis TaxID=2850323 RepID=UPI003A7F51FE
MSVLKIRIKFGKYGAMKFIGHLDIMRYFQKAMRRAGIPISYSGGYSPHMIMSFASPLGVGLTSDGEYMDIEAEECLPSEEAVRRLNDVMVEGMKVLRYRLLPDDAGNAMSLVAAADYLVCFREGCAPALAWQDQLQDFFSQDEIPILKKTKKSEKVVDIKPLIYSLELCEGDIISMRLSAGSADNLKPELVMEAFAAFSGFELPQFGIQIHRKELYARSEDTLLPLEALGEDIGE